jgi:hypothetical protein
MLHAWRLAFRHPASGEMVRVESPVPQDMRAWIQRLRQPGSAGNSDHPFEG